MANQKPPGKKSASKMSPGYEIRVSGQYYARDPNTSVKSIKVYKPESFVFPKIVSYKKGMKKEVTEHEDGSTTSKVVPDVVKANAANVSLHLIKNYYIKDRLSEKYPDFVDVRTCSIFSKEETLIDPGETRDVTQQDVRDMTKAELLQYVTMNDITVSLSNYPDLGDAKNAVIQTMAQKKVDDVAAGNTSNMTEEELLLQEPTDLFS